MYVHINETADVYTVKMICISDHHQWLRPQYRVI